jgi:hypothetical protein
LIDFYSNINSYSPKLIPAHSQTFDSEIISPIFPIGAGPSSGISFPSSSSFFSAAFLKNYLESTIILDEESIVP